MLERPYLRFWMHQKAFLDKNDRLLPSVMTVMDQCGTGRSLLQRIDLQCQVEGIAEEEVVDSKEEEVTAEEQVAAGAEGAEENSEEAEEEAEENSEEAEEEAAGVVEEDTEEAEGTEAERQAE